MMVFICIMNDIALIHMHKELLFFGKKKKVRSFEYNENHDGWSLDGAELNSDGATTFRK